MQSRKSPRSPEFGRLEQLHVVVIGAGLHGWSGIGPHQAAFPQRPVFPGIDLRAAEVIVAIVYRPCLRPLLAFRRQRRKATVRRIDDERRAPRADGLVATLIPEFVVGHDAARYII